MKMQSLSIDCEKAQKDGDLCLGYGGDEDEPCEHCKNCIKCECGYYQLGETDKDDKLNEKKKKEQKEKEQNKDWMYQQREQNELGADYFSYQGYHPPKK